MARQEIDLTTPQPNGKMGEPTKAAWEKVNDMTKEIYGLDEQGIGYAWMTDPSQNGTAKFRKISANSVDGSVTTNTVQAITSKKVFGDALSSNDRVEISKEGISGLRSSSGSVSYGFTYDSKLPVVSDQILARFQVVDITGESTYARILSSNYIGASSEYLFSHTGTALANNWQSTSDERIKTDFVEIENALEKIKSITGYASFSKRTNTFEDAEPRMVTMSGLKAQDVQRVMPAAVNASISGYDKDNKRIDGILGVDPLGVCALIIEAIKEIDNKIESIKESMSK